MSDHGETIVVDVATAAFYLIQMAAIMLMTVEGKQEDTWNEATAAWLAAFNDLMSQQVVVEDHGELG